MYLLLFLHVEFLHMFGIAITGYVPKWCPLPFTMDLLYMCYQYCLKDGYLEVQIFWTIINMMHAFPFQSKSKRRIVLGLREVTKHMKLRKIKAVIISPNLERIQSKGKLFINHLTSLALVLICYIPDLDYSISKS